MEKNKKEIKKENEKLRNDYKELLDSFTTVSIGYATEGSLNVYLRGENRRLEENIKKIKGILKAKVDMFNKMGMVDRACITQQTIDIINSYLPEIGEDEDDENE